MSILEGKMTAVDLAKSSLEKINLNERLRMHGFEPFQNGVTTIRLFGNDAIFNESDFGLSLKETKESVKINQHIFFLHYLLCDIPFTPSEEYISFRQLPEGQFYWNPFLAKTIKPLIACIGNDINKLKDKLSMFDWEEENYGDFSAKIHAVGKVNIILIYHLGDDEFPANANILFDSSILKVYKAEDVSNLSSEICISILKN